MVNIVCERPLMTKIYWFNWIALFNEAFIFSDENFPAPTKLLNDPFAGILALLATELSYKPNFFIMRMYLCQKKQMHCPPEAVCRAVGKSENRWRPG